MPGVLIKIETCLQKRLVKTFLFFLFVVIVVTAICIVNINDPPIRKRCSAEFPEFGVTLVGASKQQNGSLLSPDGNLLPPSAYWLQNGVVKVCPCAMKDCIKKCCPLDQTFDYKGECTKSNDSSALTKHFEVYSNNNKSFRGKYFESPGVKFTKSLAVIDTGCADGRMYTLSTEELYLMDNGRLWLKHYEHFMDQSKYCFEDMSSVCGKIQYAFCVDVLEDIRKLSLKRKRRSMVTASIHLVTMTLHCTTLTVFAVTPWLRSGYGKSIMCYVSAHLCKSFINIVREVWPVKETPRLCISIALVLNYLWLSARSWLLVVALQIWLALRPGPQITEEQEQRRFLHFSAFAWGLPFLQAITILATDLIQVIPEYLKPRFGKPTCWYNNRFAVAVNFIAPSVLAELTILIIFISAILRLHEYQKRSFVMNTRHCCSNGRQRMKQYLRLFMLLGFNYMLVDLVLYYNWYYSTYGIVWQSAAAISGLRGSEVFFIFVLNRNKIQLVYKQSRQKSTVYTVSKRYL